MKMRTLNKFIFLIFFVFFYGKVNAQVLTQTFIDPCTQEVTLFTIPIQNGTTIVFLNQSRFFTATDVNNGTFTAWVNQVYEQYRLTSPCSQQQGQVTQNQITSSIISSTVQSVVGSIMSSAQSSAIGGAGSSGGTNSNDDEDNSGGQQSGNNQNGSSSSSGSGGNSGTSSGGSTGGGSTGGSGSGNSGGNSGSGGSEGGSSGGGGNTGGSKPPTGGSGGSGGSGGNNGGGNTGGGGGTTGGTTGTSGNNQNGNTEQQGEEVGATTTMNNDAHNDNGGESGGSDGGGKGGKKGGGNANPMIISSDLTTAQNLDGSFTPILNLSMSKSSMTGLSSYGTTAMIWANLHQFAISTKYTKLHYSKKQTLKYIHNVSLTGVYTYGNLLGFLGYSGILNGGKYGVTGFNLSGAVSIIAEDKSGFYSPSLTAFYTRPFKVGKRVTMSPELYVMSTPLIYSTKEKVTITDRFFSGFVGSGFDYQITKRFKFNMNYKANISTNPEIPILSFFLIGSKINL